MASSPRASCGDMHCTFLLHAPAAAGGGWNDDPTAGFEKVELSDGDFEVQSPYNVPESQRFQYRNGIRTFWVYKNDKPFNTATHTNPRSEVKVKVINNNHTKKAQSVWNSCCSK